MILSGLGAARYTTIRKIPKKVGRVPELPAHEVEKTGAGSQIGTVGPTSMNCCTNEGGQGLVAWGGNADDTPDPATGISLRSPG